MVVMRSSIGRKILMAFSGFFLIFFLVQHLAINLLSVFNPRAFNETSEFMGTNPFVQYILQPILFFGIIFHLIMGMYLDLKNKQSRGPVCYYSNNPNANSSWVSRNMIYTGVMILLFIALHMVDFFFPTIRAHYITHEEIDSYQMVAHKFTSLVYTSIYLLAFLFLSLHLWHGFQSAFQSVGLRHKRYTPLIRRLGMAYAVLIPAGYALVALYHFFNA